MHLNLLMDWDGIKFNCYGIDDYLLLKIKTFDLKLTPCYE